MKHLLIILSLLLFTSPLFGQSECDETTRARMIKSGISDKTIEDQCGKIGEEEQVSEILEKTEYDLKKSDESNNPYQVQIILFSSLGSGISLYYNFKNDIWFGIDSQSTSASASSTFTTGTKSEVNVNFSTNYLNARYYLFESMPSFFIQGGLVSRSWTIELVESREFNNDRWEPNGKYNSKYPGSAINIGFGWNWISDQGISGGIHFIKIVGGSPLHTYETESGWTCSDTCKTNYETTVDELVPNFTGHINIGYNFNY